MPRDEKSIECDDKGRVDPIRDEAASGILQARCWHITSEKYVNVETARYCRLGEPAKTLDTDLRMSIALSRDVLRWPTASFQAEYLLRLSRKYNKCLKSE